MATIKSVSKFIIDGDWIESKDQSPEGIRLVQTGNIGIGEYLDKHNRAKYISEETFERLNCTELVVGDILVSRLPDPIGRACVVPKSIGKAITSVDCTIVRLDPERCDTQYFVQYTQSELYQNRLSQFFAGSTRTRISRKNLEQIEIPLPTISEQKRIASTLGKVDELIALRKEQITKLNQLVKSQFIELFGATSADKCSKRIKDYAEVLGGYAFKSDLFCTDAVPVIRISNINNGCVELDYDICFDELFWKQNEKFRAEQNDILMAMSGATTGKAGIYREDMPALINQRVACIRAKDGIAYPTFLFVATQLEWMYDLIQETSAGCAQPNISGKQIENMPVPDATYEQQQQFAAFVEQTDKSKLAIQQSLDKLELLKKSLMQEYFG